MVANDWKKPLFMTYVLLGVAITLSTVAEYYAIVGLVTIFAGAPISIALMGAVLGIAKITLTSWLYRNWSETPLLVRTYFVTAIAILMLLTSMGIFGFLSKAHVDQNLSGGDVLAQLSIIDEKLKTERENLDANRKIINQLDSQVNETIARTSETDTTGASINRSIRIRNSQEGERASAQKAILSAQAAIAKLNEERAPIAAKARAVEAEVGPIKYIAQLIYGQEATDKDTLESAIRWVIILIVSVFDPLAVLMFIAVNQDLRRKTVSHPIQKIDSVHNEIQIEKIDSGIDKKIDSPDTLKTDQIEKIDSRIDKKIDSKPKRKRRTKDPIVSQIDPPVQDIIEWERDRKLVPVDDK